MSPQFAAAFHLQPEKTRLRVGRERIQGGRVQPASPPGTEVYGEEHTWNFEGGVKTTWANGRVAANAAVFRIDWEDMQLNLPNLFVPGEFYIANVGGATSSGVELELNARVHPNVDVFGGIGYTKAEFDDDSISGGVPVGGNTMPNTPDYTGIARRSGLAESVRRAYALRSRRGHVLRRLRVRRPEHRAAGRVLAGQFPSRRARPVRVRRRRGSGTRSTRKYIPVAFAYGQLAPSGFIGEMGRPRTFGVTAGVGF